MCTKHTQTKQICHRISRAAGHLTAIGHMVEEGRDCADILVQLSAVRSALNSIGKLVITDHMQHCLSDALSSGNQAPLEQFTKALETYLK